MLLKQLGYRVQIPRVLTTQNIANNTNYTTHSISLGAGTWLITGTQELSISSPLLQRAVVTLLNVTAGNTTLGLQVDATNNSSALTGTSYYYGITQVIQLTGTTTIGIRVSFTVNASTMTLSAGDTNYFSATRLG